MLEYPVFLVNYKGYEGTTGDDGLAFAETIERVAADVGVRFALAPQPPDLRWLAERASLPLVAQTGVPRERAGTGDVTLEAVADAGADGVFVTHPEADVGLGSVGRAVARCRDLGLESIVWAPDRESARAALAFDPDCLLFERPGDIASEEGMVRTDPARVERFVEAVAEADARVFVGGGVRTPADVERAFDCGVDATGAASAAVEARDREAWLRSIASALPAGRD